MNFTRRKAVSPIIASLLLIAIAVAAGIIVYIYVNGLAGGLTQGGGQQTTERLQLQAYNFNVSPGPANGCACSGDILQISMIDSGSSSTTISAVYFDGAAQAITTPPTVDTALASTEAFAIPTSTTLTSTAADTSEFRFSAATQQTAYTVGLTGQVVITFAAGSAPTSGTTHTVKIVSSTGAQFIFTVVAGKSG